MAALGLLREYLLAGLDSAADVLGQSTVLGRHVRDFLRQRRERATDSQYERAYEGVSYPLGGDFEGWEEEGIWPTE